MQHQKSASSFFLPKEKKAAHAKALCALQTGKREQERMRNYHQSAAKKHLPWGLFRFHFRWPIIKDGSGHIRRRQTRAVSIDTGFLPLQRPLGMSPTLFLP
nr:hypothetical protein [Pandoravirus massiliensis]